MANFNKVLVSKNNVFNQEATWFKAMALIENNKKDDAKDLLLEIVNAGGFYTNRASQKLKETN